MKLLITLISLFALLLAVTASAVPSLSQPLSADTNNLNDRSPQNYKVKGIADALDESSSSTENSATTDRSTGSDLLLDPETLETRQQGSCGSPFEPPCNSSPHLHPAHAMVAAGVAVMAATGFML